MKRTKQTFSIKRKIPKIAIAVILLLTTTLSSALAAEDTLVPEDEIIIHGGTLNQHNLEEATDTVLTLQENISSNLRSERNREEPTRISDLLNVNIEQMCDSSNIINSDTSSSNMITDENNSNDLHFASSGDGFYQVLSDYLTAQGQNKFVVTIQ